MRERPIIFNGEMVKAILDGRKTQTRRVIKPQPEYGSDTVKLFSGVSVAGNDWRFGVSGVCGNKVDWFDRWYKCPYGNPGDRLWVRETFWYDVRDPDSIVIYDCDRLVYKDRFSKTGQLETECSYSESARRSDPG